MDINNLISSIGLENLNKDCILHSMLRIYIDKKSSISSRDDQEAGALANQVKDHADVLRQLLKYAKCFPASCNNCEGLTKCINCIIKNKCVDASIEFYKFNQRTSDV